MITPSDLFSPAVLSAFVKAGFMQEQEPGVLTWTATGRVFIELCVGMVSGTLDKQAILPVDAYLNSKKDGEA